MGTMYTVYGISAEELIDRIENKTAYVVRDNVKQNCYLLFSDVPTIALNSAIHDAFDLPWTIPDSKDKGLDGYTPVFKVFKPAFKVNTICNIDSAEERACDDVDFGANMADLEAKLANGNLYRNIMNNCIYDSNNGTAVDSIDLVGLCFIDFDESEQKFNVKRFDINSTHLKEMLEDVSNLYERAYRLAYARAILKKQSGIF